MDPWTGEPPRARYTCLGIGVGPANLSLASLLHSHPHLSNVFLDRKEHFTWHDGQQIPGASLQVTMFKDLVSLSDPTNAFSFLSYLHVHGRMYHFINAEFEAVPREEFRNYMEWASRTNENVVFGEEVLSVDFDGLFSVRTAKRTLTAENISVGVGHRPWVPPAAQGKADTATQFHVCEYVDKATDLGGKRVAVVGGGQSGAEAFLDLLSRPDAERPARVLWISRRRNFFPIDDSPFTNDYYMPCHSEYFFGLDRARREAFNRELVLSSDGISLTTLRQIYQQIYVYAFVRGARDLVGLYPHRTVTGVEGDGAGGWTLKTSKGDQPGAVERFDADVVVWATGFRPGPMEFLAPIRHRLQFEGDELLIDEDFAARWDGPADRMIFVQNAARGQRGLADPNLSLMAWRSQRVVDRLHGVASAPPVPSFIEWAAGGASTGAAPGAGAPRDGAREPSQTGAGEPSQARAGEPSRAGTEEQEVTTNTNGAQPEPGARGTQPSAGRGVAAAGLPSSVQP